jgi:hypothetical protein
MKVSLEATEEARTVYSGLGRKRKVCDATIGGVTVTGTNKVEAAALLQTALLARTLAPAPIARLLKDGRMAVAYLDTSTDSTGDLGWCCQMFHPDGRTSGSLGSDLNGCTVNSTPGDVERALRREFEKYTNGIDDVS